MVAQLMFKPPKPRRLSDPSAALDEPESPPEGAGGQGEDLFDDGPPPTPEPPLKRILMYNGLYDWEQSWKGRSKFLVDECPVNTCFLTENKNEASTADAIVFRHYFRHPNVHRQPKQVRKWPTPDFIDHTQKEKVVKIQFNSEISLLNSEK